MNDKILLLFDIDGTLTNPRSKMTDDMYNFMLELKREETVILGVVGGSDYNKIREQIGDNIFNIFKYVFSENGLVFYKDGNLMHNISLTQFVTKTELDEFVSYSQKYIDYNEVITGVKKIDLMGGDKSQLGGEFVNIDIRESIKVGIKGDATKLSKIIKKNSIDELVSNNPYLGGVFTAEDYIKEVAEVMNISAGAVEKNITSALKILHNELHSFTKAS